MPGMQGIGCKNHCQTREAAGTRPHSRKEGPGNETNEIMKSKSIRKMKLLALPFAAALLVSSCVTADRDNCRRNNFTLEFYYSPDIRGNAANPSELASIHVYMFDGEERYLEDFWLTPSFTESQEEARVTLYSYSHSRYMEPGSYNFIAWVNQDSNYDVTPQMVVGQTTRSEAEFILNKALVDFTLKPLMYGETGLSQVIRGDTRLTMGLYQYTRKVNLWFRGTGIVNDGDSFDYNILANNGKLPFFPLMGPNPVPQPLGNPVDYRTHAPVESAVAFGSLTTLRLWDKKLQNPFQENARLTITRNSDGQTLIDEDLIALIEQAAENMTRSGGTRAAIDFDQIFEYDLYIILDSQMGISVGLDQWNYFPGGGDL